MIRALFQDSRKDLLEAVVYINEIHGEVRSKCNFCGKSFSSEAPLSKHISNYHEGNYSCKYNNLGYKCSYSFKNSILLEAHIFKEHESNHHKSTTNNVEKIFKLKKPVAKVIEIGTNITLEKTKIKTNTGAEKRFLLKEAEKAIEIADNTDLENNKLKTSNNSENFRCSICKSNARFSRDLPDDKALELHNIVYHGELDSKDPTNKIICPFCKNFEKKDQKTSYAKLQISEHIKSEHYGKKKNMFKQREKVIEIADNNTENTIVRDKAPCTNVIVIAYDSYSIVRNKCRPYVY